MAKGQLNKALVCPHCTAQGTVFTAQVKRKAGISGGKAVLGVLSGGVSLLVPGVGLSRREQMTEAFCDRCKSVWNF
jgi:hypothetical protein